MAYVDMIRVDNTGNVVRRWRGPWQVIRVYGPGIGYLFHNGLKVHYERVRLFEPHMAGLKIKDRGNYVCVASTAEPIEEIFPEDAATEAAWSESSDDGQSQAERTQPRRHCKKKRNYDESQQSDSLASESDGGETADSEMSLTSDNGVMDIPSDLDLEKEILSDCPSYEAHPDTDEEFWEQSQKRAPPQPGQLLHEVQRDQILAYFLRSQRGTKSLDDIRKWVDDLMAYDPDAFVPGLFSDEESTYSTEELLVDAEYAEEVQQASKNEKKRQWLIQQCIACQEKSDETTLDPDGIRGRTPLEEGGEEKKKQTSPRKTVTTSSRRGESTIPRKQTTLSCPPED